nr:MAG TPA: hypothetical protein [Caudoviricetes sp.]
MPADCPFHRHSSAHRGDSYLFLFRTVTFIFLKDFVVVNKSLGVPAYYPVYPSPS